MINITPQKKAGFKKIRIRIVLLGLAFLAAFALLSARAFELHLTDNQKLNQLAKNQYKRRVVVAPKRGNILDAQGETLAIDIKVDSVYATPHRIENPEILASTLADLTSIPQQKIIKKLNKKKKKFVWVQRRISPELSVKIKQQKLEGIGFLPEYKRFYPNGSLAANLLGAVGFDAEALSGLELAYDKTLKSEDPPLLVEQDAKGRSYAPYALVGLENPNQVVLTIDKTIQYIAERELGAMVEKSRAKGGVAIVMEAETGAILAMAVSPTFDPNEYYKHDFKNWRNRAITDIFEPGSTFKAITAAAALEFQILDLEKKLHCGNGTLKVGSNTIHDHHPYGWLNLGEIIKYSSNVCSFKLSQKIGKERFLTFIRDFGFGSKTGVEAPGELAGIVASPKRISPLQIGTIGFGQGISTTPLQIATAYGAIANGGFLMQPLLIKKILDSKGNPLKTFGPKIIRRVLSESTARQTAALLKTVVEKGGTGTQARLEGYSVAGKTGTAQKVIEGQKGYAKNKYVASFVGFAPVENPKLVVLVSIDEPKGAYYGGVVSAPVFQKIMGQSLAYLKVSPREGAPRPPASRHASVAKPKKITPKAVTTKERTPENKKLKKRPKSNTDPEALASAEEPGDGLGKPVPDLTGISVREALRKVQATQFKVKIQGSGICFQQDPSAGHPAEAGSAITLECRPPI